MTYGDKVIFENKEYTIYGIRADQFDLIGCENGIFVKNVNRNYMKKVNEIPERYKKVLINGLDVIDIIGILDLNFQEGNILKYVLRKKDQDIEDMGKIIVYAERELKRLKSVKKPANPHGSD